MVCVVGGPGAFVLSSLGSPQAGSVVELEFAGTFVQLKFLNLAQTLSVETKIFLQSPPSPISACCVYLSDLASGLLCCGSASELDVSLDEVQARLILKSSDRSEGGIQVQCDIRTLSLGRGSPTITLSPPAVVRMSLECEIFSIAISQCDVGGKKIHLLAQAGDMARPAVRIQSEKGGVEAEAVVPYTVATEMGGSGEDSGFWVSQKDATILVCFLNTVGKCHLVFYAGGLEVRAGGSEAVFRCLGG